MFEILVKQFHRNVVAASIQYTAEKSFYNNERQSSWFTLVKFSQSSCQSAVLHELLNFFTVPFDSIMNVTMRQRTKIGAPFRFQ